MFNKSGWADIFKFRCILTPISIELLKYEVGYSSMSYRSLYIFGIRIARWRTETEL